MNFGELTGLTKKCQTSANNNLSEIKSGAFKGVSRYEVGKLEDELGSIMKELTGDEVQNANTSDKVSEKYEDLLDDAQKVAEKLKRTAAAMEEEEYYEAEQARLMNDKADINNKKGADDNAGENPENGSLKTNLGG